MIVLKIKGFSTGMFQVQDESSMLVGEIVSASVSQKIQLYATLFVDVVRHLVVSHSILLKS